jgi:hypothetical protein
VRVTQSIALSIQFAIFQTSRTRFGDFCCSLVTYAHSNPLAKVPRLLPGRCRSTDPLITRCLSAWVEHQEEAQGRAGLLQRAGRALKAFADRTMDQDEVVFLPTGCLVRLGSEGWVLGVPGSRDPAKMGRLFLNFLEKKYGT